MRCIHALLMLCLAIGAAAQDVEIAMTFAEVSDAKGERDEKIGATRIVDLAETVTLALAEIVESTDTAKLEKASEAIDPSDALEFVTIYEDRIVTDTQTVKVLGGVDLQAGEVTVKYEDRITTHVERDQSGRMRVKLRDGIARFEDGKLYQYERKADVKGR